METEWTLEQRELSKKQLPNQQRNPNELTKLVALLLKKCKEHDGLTTNLNELSLFLNPTHKEDKKKFFRQEVQLQKITHKKDSIKRPELYKLNG